MSWWYYKGSHFGGEQSKARLSKGFYLAQGSCFAHALLYSANGLLDPIIECSHGQSKESKAEQDTGG